MLIFARINTAATMHTILLIVLALVQYYVYCFRGRSFTLSDLRTMGTAAEVAGNYSYIPEHRVILCLAGAVIWCVLSDKKLVAKHASLKLEMWNIDREYRHKGVLLMLASEVQYLTVPKPENYSVENVKNIATENDETYQQKQKTVAVNEQNMPENLILIMNESLADLRHLGACEDQMDVMPNLDTITSNHGSVYKGYLQVPVFGGGTANTEYEALTGNCMAFWDNWTIAYQVYS